MQFLIPVNRYINKTENPIKSCKNLLWREPEAITSLRQVSGNPLQGYFMKHIGTKPQMF
jgi:hypothetical protein